MERDALSAEIRTLRADKSALTSEGIDKLQEQLASLRDADERWRAESGEKVRLAEEVCSIR